jgi:sugar diacid utilization regulator
MTDLQGLVDALAVELGRPVGLDDRRFRALAYSAHLDDVDDVRRASILHREAPRAVTEWLESRHVGDADGLARVPRNSSLGMEARVCVPVRFNETLLGYLWLIDEPQPITEQEGRAALRCAADLGVELFRIRRLESQERTREAELIGELVLGTGSDEQAARELGSLLTVGAYAAIVVKIRLTAPHLDPAAVKVRLAASLEQVRHRVPPRQFSMLATHDQALAIVMVDSVAAERRARTILAAAEDQFADEDGFAVSVGVGATRTELRELRESYAEAVDAAQVAAQVPGAGPIAVWSELGSYRTITRLLRLTEPGPLIPVCLMTLLQAPEAATLVSTLETYLDHAGDAQAAAAALFVHRSTLYNRLHRIEELTGSDLRRGDDRLELHVALRMWRIASSPLTKSRDHPTRE